MKRSASKLFAAIIVITAVIFITAAMFVFTLLLTDLAPESVREYLNSALIDSQAVYMILIFSLCLLVALAVLGISAVFSLIPLIKKSPKRKRTKKEKKAVSRFSRLKKIDKEQKKRKVKYSEAPALDILCSRFRDYAASKLGLYYDISDIRRFVAGMSMSKLIILRGISGTGKTSLAYAAGEFFGNPSTIVPIQPMWKERSDMIGYFNEFTKKFNETTMLAKLYEAGGNGDLYLTVLDEVNIARIEYYFAEFLSLLEIPDAKRRYLDVVADTWDSDPKRIENGKLLLPENMYFIGTANNDDSTFAISDKVYDRAAVIDLERKCKPFEGVDPTPCHISYEGLIKLFDDAKAKYSLSDASREKLARLDAYMTDIFRVSFGNRIMKQIEIYVPVMIACGGSEENALDDILARKILRKLEQLSPAFVKNEADALTDTLDELFGEDALPISREFIEKLKKGF